MATPPPGRTAAPPPGWVPATGPTTGPGAPGPWGTPPPSPGPPGPPTAAAAEPATRPYLKPTGAAVVLLLLAVAALLMWLVSDAAPQLAVAVALVAGMAVDAVSARRAVSALEIDIDGPTEAVAGSPTEWPIRLRGLRRPVALCPALLPPPLPTLVEHPSPGRLVLPGASRGVVHHVIVDAFAHGPVGLFQAARRYRLTPPSPVPIGPPAVEIDIDWPTPKAVGFGLSPVAPRGDDLFRSVRPYERGDERRRIHWKATAHHGELMVRENDGLGMVALQVVVDLGPPGPTAEMVAGVAAHVAAEAVRKGWLVQLVTLDSASAPPPLLGLGSPFGLPPARPQARWQALETQARRVGGPDAIRAQLATAAFGTPQAPEWGALVCTVSPAGLEWR